MQRILFAGAAIIAAANAQDDGEAMVENTEVHPLSIKIKEQGPACADAMTAHMVNMTPSEQIKMQGKSMKLYYDSMTMAKETMYTEVEKEFRLQDCDKEPKFRDTCRAMTGNFIKEGAVTYATPKGVKALGRICKFQEEIKECALACDYMKEFFGPPSVEDCDKVPAAWKKGCLKRASGVFAENQENKNLVQAHKKHIRSCKADTKVAHKKCQDVVRGHMKMIVEKMGDVTMEEHKAAAMCFLQPAAEFAACVREAPALPEGTVLSLDFMDKKKKMTAAELQAQANEFQRKVMETLTDMLPDGMKNNN